MTSDHCSPIQRRPRFLKVAATIVAAQLLAFALLTVGYGLGRSLAIPVTLAAIFLAWPLLGRIARVIRTFVHRVALTVTRRVFDRRSYRFGLRTLLLLVLIVAAIAGWYFHGQRLVSAERRRFEGKWQIVNRDGLILKSPDGTPRIFDFSDSDYSVDPRQDPKQLDFHTPVGTMYAIYRWDGDEIVIMQVSPGVQRPTSFDQTDLQPIPGVNIPQYSVSTYRLVRAVD